MQILIQNRQRKYQITDRIREMINKILEEALKQENIHAPIELSVVFMNNSGIKELNREYRDKNKPTDVLSFPMYERDELKDILKKNMNASNENLLLGDIIISLEKAEEQAKEYGHSFEREVGYLTTHGVFHLLGYDHEQEDEKAVMRQMEEKTLNAVGLARE